MNHLELFSGIGGFRRALDLLSQDQIMDFHCVGYSEIDTNARATYQAVYDIEDDEIDMGDIVAFTGSENRMATLRNVKFDLVTGGFPCQSFSMMGSQAGFEDKERGQMFFRIMDIVDAKKPKYLLLENVKNLFTHDNKRTYQRIEAELLERGYTPYSNIFNSADFGLPQVRNRVIIFATRCNVPKGFKEAFTPENVKEHFWKNRDSMSLFTYESTLDILRREVPAKYFLSARIKPTILADGSANFKSNSEINKRIARTLTASMHKMHRACQDNYYSQDFIESNGEVNPALFCTKEELAERAIRKITPQEAFMLQGFPGEFAETAMREGVSDGALYKQAGNAVSVNTIYAVLHYLITHKAIK